MITIESFPLPPSVNELYINIRMRGRPGRVKSQVYKAYIIQCQKWARLNATRVLQFKQLIAAMPKDKALHIESTFHFKESAILTKVGRPKRNDTSNRLKALDDQLSELLNIDDCLFWSGNYTKCTVKPGESERVSIKITQISFISPV